VSFFNRKPVGAPRAPGGFRISQQKVISLTTFTDFGLNDAILRALAEEKYLTPTAIHAQTVPIVMSDRDVIGIAQTGTGKTAAVALPILHRLAADPRPAARKSWRVLVLPHAPSRRDAAAHAPRWTSQSEGF
jgi:superfamily II DNA/RNA helicase